MFFRNLTMFRFPTSLDLSSLEELLAGHPLKPVGALELSSRGFVPPFGREGEAFSHRVGQSAWITLGGEDRLLPSSVVNDMLAKRIAEVEEKQGRRPGGRMRKQMKDDLVHELLPRAFVRPSRTDALLDLGHGVCVVDTSSRKTGETVVSEIRHALGSFRASADTQADVERIATECGNALYLGSPTRQLGIPQVNLTTQTGYPQYAYQGIRNMARLMESALTHSERPRSRLFRQVLYGDDAAEAD